MNTDTTIFIPRESRKRLEKTVGQPLTSKSIISTFSGARSSSRNALLLVDSIEAISSLTSAWNAASSVKIAFHAMALFLYDTAEIVNANALVEAFQHRQKVHKHAFMSADPRAFKRLILANLHQAQRKLIASAQVSGDELLVWSCEPNLYSVSFAAIPALSGIPKKLRSEFTISASGSRIHWERNDVDLSLESVLYFADPEYRKEAEKKTRTEVRSYAKAIRTLRKQYGLKQADCGMSDRELRRIESGEVTPHSNSLAKLASAHGMSIEAYLSSLAKLA